MDELEALKSIRNKTIDFIHEMYLEAERPQEHRKTEWHCPGAAGRGAMEVLKDICLELERLDPGTLYYDQSHNPTIAEVEEARRGLL